MNHDTTVLTKNERTRAPRTAEELAAFLQTVHENVGEVEGWRLNTNHHAVVNMNIVNGDDKMPPLYLVSARGHNVALMHELERMLLSSRCGFGPSAGEVAHVWKLLDTAAA